MAGGRQVLGAAGASPAPTAAVTTPADRPPPPTVKVPLAPARGAWALAYLEAHAAPGILPFCRPGPLHTALGSSAGHTCVPGKVSACPDGVAEINITEPGCAANYEKRGLQLVLELRAGRRHRARSGRRRPNVGSLRCLPHVEVAHIRAAVGSVYRFG